MSAMRTTLTLDDDVADYLKEQSKLRGIPFKQVVNQTIRNGMTPSGAKSDISRFEVTPHKSEFCSGVDLLKLNQLVDELETEDFINKAGNDYPGCQPFGVCL